MFLKTKNLISKNHLNIFGKLKNPFLAVNSKFQFARKTGMETVRTENKKLQYQPNISNSVITDIDLTQTQITVKPYFSKAVSEKEKSYSSLNISNLIQEASSRKQTMKEATGLEDPSKMKDFKIQKGKDKKKSQVKKKVQTIVENIKRDLPHDL